MGPGRNTMIQLLFQQQYLLFVLIAFALIFSLTFHEFGHAKVASLIGDDTARRAGRLTLNPVPHIDPVGLLMVLLIISLTISAHAQAELWSELNRDCYEKTYK